MEERRIYDAQWVADYFDNFGEKEWERLVASPAAEVSLHVHTHYLRKHVRAGDDVLEVGAAAGRFTQVLAELQARIVVTDLSGKQLDLNWAHAVELGLDAAVERRLQLDMCDMAVLPDAAFDVVVCYGGPLSYVFERREQGLREMVRVLKPGGVLLAGVMSLWGAVHENLTGVFEVPATANREIIRTGDLCPENYPGVKHRGHLFRAAEFRILLESAGLSVLDISTNGCLCRVWDDLIKPIRADPGQWAELLTMEVEASREPGCLDMGPQIIGVARKPAGEGVLAESLLE